METSFHLILRSSSQACCTILDSKGKHWNYPTYLLYLSLVGFRLITPCTTQRLLEICYRHLGNIISINTSHIKHQTHLHLLLTNYQMPDITFYCCHSFSSRMLQFHFSGSLPYPSTYDSTKLSACRQKQKVESIPSSFPEKLQLIMSQRLSEEPHKTDS